MQDYKVAKGLILKTSSLSKLETSFRTIIKTVLGWLNVPFIENCNPCGNTRQPVSTLNGQLQTNNGSSWVDVDCGCDLPFDTYEDWNNMRVLGTLPINTEILITDRADKGIRIYTNSEGNGFASGAVGGFLNADFVAADNEDVSTNATYSGIEILTTFAPTIQRGVFELNTNQTQNGDIVIYNNLHYQLTNIDSFDFMEFNDEFYSTAYTLLPRTLENAGYNLVWDTIQYDFVNDVIISRTSLESHIIGLALNDFPWGDENVKIITDSLITSLNVLNNRGTITGRVFGLGHNLDFSFNSGTIIFDVTGTSQVANCFNNSGILELHLIGSTVGVHGNNNTGFVRSYLYNQSKMYFDDNEGTIVTRLYDQSILTSENNAGVIQDCIFERGTNCVVILNNAIVWTNNKVSWVGSIITFPTDVNYSNKEFNQGTSTFDIQLDLDDPLIFGSGSLQVPEYTGVIRLYSDLGLSYAIDFIASSTIEKNFYKAYSDGTITFNHSASLVNKNFSNRILSFADTDSISYKYNLLSSAFVESDFITFI